MSQRSLEDLLQSVASPVELLRNSQLGANVFPGVPPEFTSWRDEQWAWQNTCILFDQSFHMNDLLVEGPDAVALLSSLAVNSFDGFGVGKAKHFVPCTPDGYVIGDVILFALDENRFNLVGRAPSLNWITYHAEKGGYDVQLELDLRTALRSDGLRRSYRFQLQGPNAMEITERVLGQAPPDLKFFNTTTLTIAGKSVGALRHGMVGQPGWELFGPWSDREAVLEAILAVGDEFGLRRSGGRAYSSNTVESGWIPSPLPAVYSGDGLKEYREWLPAAGYEGSASVGGSLDSPDIEDFYFTPWDLGYGSYVKFDHDFIGREALEGMADEDHRHKVTLALDDEDVTRTIGTMFQKTRSREVHRLARRGVRDAPVRPRHSRRRDGRGVDLDRLQLERGQDADPRGARLRARGAGDRGHAPLGRGGRRHHEADRRAARADGDPSSRQPRAVRRDRPEVLCARRLAGHVVRVRAEIVDNIGADLVESIITSTRVLIRHVVAVVRTVVLTTKSLCHVEGGP